MRLGGESRRSTFTAGLTGQLDRVSLTFGGASSLPEEITVEFANTVAGVPGTDVLASGTVASSAIPEGFLQFDIDFASPASVVAGATYAIVLPATSAGYAFLGHQAPGMYAGGDAYLWYSSEWGWQLDSVEFGGSYPGTGLVFRTYVSAAAPPNDERANALLIDLPYSASIDTTAATVDTDDPTCYEATPLGASVWYSFTPTWSGSLAIEAVLSNYFVGVAVFHGSDMLECRPSSSGAFVEGIVANETYHVLFFDTEPSDGIGGTLDFRMMRSVEELIVSVNVDSAVITAPGELTISARRPSAAARSRRRSFTWPRRSEAARQ